MKLTQLFTVLAVIAPLSIMGAIPFVLKRHLQPTRVVQTVDEPPPRMEIPEKSLTANPQL